MPQERFRRREVERSSDRGACGGHAGGMRWAWGQTEFQVNLKLGLTPRSARGKLGSIINSLFDPAVSDPDSHIMQMDGAIYSC